MQSSYTRGSFGLRFGALPGSLNTLSEIAIGADGVLYAISGEAIFRWPQSCWQVAAAVVGG
jgi:hypothetical protein